MPGPYKRRRKLTVRDESWHRDDIVVQDGVRWMIRSIDPRGTVVLESSNTSNHRIRRSTYLAHLPQKGTRP